MLIIEGRIFYNGKLTQGMIGIENGKIVDVKKILKGDDHIDLGDRIILPGAVDPHVHFRDPGMTHKEDFTSGSTAALYGGVTCVLDMPNTKPPVTGINALEEKKQTVKGKSFVDYGLFAALTPKTNTEALAPMVCGFKLFMGSTTGDILMSDENAIYKAMTAAGKTGKRISVHAEDNSMIGYGEEKNNRDHLRNRPVSAEHSAIHKLARYKGMPINICHITDAGSAVLASSFGFMTEVTTHHLFFDDGVSEGAEFKVNPPLRDYKTKEKLYKAFAENKITMFGSDHAPHTIDEKHREYNDAPSGIPGVETYVPIMMDLVKKGKVQLSNFVKMAATAPADAFNINKGKIEKGRDADLMIFDMRNSKKIKEKGLHSKACYTVYEGWDAIFPDMVIIRGEIQLKDGELCGDAIGRDICG